MEIILSLLIPLITTFFSYPLIIKEEFFRKLPLALKLCLSLGLGVSTIVITLSLWGMVIPFGFKLTSIVLFMLTVFASVHTLRKISLTKQRVKQILLKLSTFYQKRTTLIVISIYISIFLLIFILKPVIDSDVIDSYLTLARSIIIYDKIPSHNFYDNRPFIIPPVGGPVLFAFYYALSPNSTTEIFRLINLPFFLGFVILTYYILRDYFSGSLSLLGVLILLTFPLVEDLIFQASLYPDFIFSFLAVLCFYLTSKIYQQRLNSTAIFLFLGILMASALLIKYQAFFLYILIFILLSSTISLGKIKFLLLSVIYSPFLLDFLGEIGPFQKASNLNFFIFVTFLTSTAFLFFSKKPKSIYQPKTFLPLFISFLGFIFIVRNFLIFGGLEDKTAVYRWVVEQEKAIGVPVEGGNAFNAWLLFLAPSLSLFWLLPKIVGLVRAFFRQKIVLPLFIFIAWYSYWVLFLGATDTKWLLPVLPYLALVILLGLKSIFRQEPVIKMAVFWSIPFMLISSKFIFWNLSILHFGQSTTRQIANVLQSGNSVASFLSSSGNVLMPYLVSQFSLFVQKILKVIFLLTSRTLIEAQDIGLLLFLALLSFLVIYKLSFWLPKFKPSIAFVLLILFPYFYIFWAVSGGNLANFSDSEQNKLFDYWGQSTYLVPYLKKNAQRQDKVVIFGIQSGLSYFSQLKVYNLQYGGGLSLFYPIYKQKDKQKIYHFFKDQNIKYVAILEYKESIDRFNNLKDRTQIFDILADERYTKEVLTPEKDNFWRLYEVI